MKIRAVGAAMQTRPWLAALAGGVPIAVVAIVSPILLFSGQSQVGEVIANSATFGVFALLGLGIAKLLLSGWSLSTTYFGGPVFPLIFAGACFGLAANLLVPGIPQGVAVMALIAGLVSAAVAAPLSITVFLALIADPSLMSVIAIAAVGGYLVRQAVAPAIPSVFSALREMRPETVPAEES